jgi:hypothetical protein
VARFLLTAKNIVPISGMQAMENIQQPTSAMNELEFEVMATVLEARHGRLAAEVADFFASLHVEIGDEGRFYAWADVAERVRQREQDRLLQD